MAAKALGLVSVAARSLRLGGHGIVRQYLHIPSPVPCPLSRRTHSAQLMPQIVHSNAGANTQIAILLGYFQRSERHGECDIYGDSLLNPVVCRTTELRMKKEEL